MAEVDEQQDDQPKRIKVKEVAAPVSMLPPAAEHSILSLDEYNEAEWALAEIIAARMGGGYRIVPPPPQSPLAPFLQKPVLGETSGVPSGVTQDPSNPCPTHGPVAGTELSPYRIDKVSQRIIHNPEGYL